MGLPAIPELTWDLIEDPEGFSAEITADLELSPAEIDAFHRAVTEAGQVVEIVHEAEVRGAAILDEDTLWLVVHAIGPGRFDRTVASVADEVLRQQWNAVHLSARRLMESEES